jgi:hypothetical protein
MHTALTGDLYQRDEGRAWIGGKLYVFGGDAQSDTGHVVHCVRTRWNVIDKRDAPGCALEHPNKGIPPSFFPGTGWRQTRGVPIVARRVNFARGGYGEGHDQRQGGMGMALMTILAMNGAAATLLWLVAVVLVIAGIVTLVRGGLLAGIVLILVGLLIGPGGVSIFH